MRKNYILDAVTLFYLGKLLYLLSQSGDSIKKYFFETSLMYPWPD